MRSEDGERERESPVFNSVHRLDNQPYAPNEESRHGSECVLTAFEFGCKFLFGFVG